MVAQVWGVSCHSNPLIDIWYKLKRLKIPLKSLNSQPYQGTAQRVAGFREQLKQVQLELQSHPLNTDLVAQEHSLLAHLQKWSDIEAFESWARRAQNRRAESLA